MPRWGGQHRGGFILNGTKIFVHDAHIADQIICVARTGESRSQAGGLTIFLIDARVPGLAIRTLPGFTGARLNELTFESVAIPARNVIGTVDHGWSDLEPVLDVATAALCAWMVGGAERAFELSLDYSRARVQFGVPIGTFTRVQDHLIEIVNALDAARWTTYEALWKLDTDQPAMSAVSVAKIATSEAYHSICNLAHEVHAAIGLTREYGLYLYTQAARTFYDYLGGPSHHRRRLASLLGLSAGDWMPTGQAS